MTATLVARNTPERIGGRMGYPIKGSTLVLQGTLCVLDAGYAKGGAEATDLVCIGRALDSYDNTDGDDGDISGMFEFGTFRWENGESIAQSDVGSVAYVYDNQTVKTTSTGRSAAGEIVAIDGAGVWVKTPEDMASIKDLIGSSATLSSSTPSASGPAAAAGSSSEVSKADHVHAWCEKKTVTITDATLTDAVAGEAQTINVGSALPAKAIVVGVIMTLTTQLTGGSVSAVDVDLGWSGSTEALVKDFDALGSTASGAVYDAGASAATFGMPKLASAKQIIATFTPDGGHALSALTAGSLTIDVFYVEGF